MKSLLSIAFNSFLVGLFLVLYACSGTDTTQTETQATPTILLSQEIKSYWYSGLAEISSYELTQQRYGEERKGKAVLIYVTEDFDAHQLVKADQANESNFPVLKLNATKDFTTGIYPYHIMQSSFLPMEQNSYPAKVTASIQEWCGQSFMMLESKENYELQLNSYFQNSGNQRLQLKKVASENALWNQLRLFPTQLDTTMSSMLPSFEYLRLHHKEAKAYDVNITQQELQDTLVTQLFYPSLQRKLNIFQTLNFPYPIVGWEEELTQNDTTYTTRAKKIKTLQIDYWNKNKEIHSPLRDSLQL